MEIGSWIVFFLSIAAWLSVRTTYPLTENHRVIMWMSSVSLMLLPAFVGSLSSHPLVVAIWWPFLAGFMAGEFVWTKMQQRRARKAREERESKERVKSLSKKTRRSKSEG